MEIKDIINASMLVYNRGKWLEVSIASFQCGDSEYKFEIQINDDENSMSVRLREHEIMKFIGMLECVTQSVQTRRIYKHRGVKG